MTEERLQLAIQSTNLGFWEYSVLTNQFIASEECRKIFGIAEKDKTDYANFQNCIYPQDKTMVESDIAMSAKDFKVGGFETIHRIIRQDDQAIRWVRSYGKIFFNAENKSERYLGTVVDITQQRNMDELLRQNESRARLAIETAGLGTFEYNVERSLFEHSERLAEMFGYPKTEKLTHVKFSERIHPDDQKIRKEANERTAESGILFYEARILLPDQSIRWVRLNGVLVKSSYDGTSVLYGTAFDITKSRAKSHDLEKLVEASEERYHRMIDEVEDYAIISLSTDGIIQNWNTGAEKIKLYKAEEAIGRHFSIFYLPEDREKNLPQSLMMEAFNNGKALHEGWRLRKDGTRFWGSIVITSLHNDHGDHIGFSKVTRDLSERKAAEEKVLAYMSQLEIRNEELEQFAFIASHDLQEPLRKIQTFSELIQSRLHDTDFVKRYFDKINVSALRMRDLITATLNYSRLSRDNADKTYQVDLNKILSEVKLDMELLITEKMAIIRSDKLPVVKAIPIQITQVFANLIANAIKFSTQAPRIDITYRIVAKDKIIGNPDSLTDHQYTEICFKDNGIGFEAQYANKIFAIFQRLHGKHEFEGTGIGLALCKKIMENHHGHIAAESVLGEGAEFFIYFPI